MTDRNHDKAPDYRRLMHDALVELEALQSQVDDLRRQRSEPTAVVGIGCRFPGGDDGPAAFWRVLHGGVDAVGEIPPERWLLADYFDPDPDAPGKLYARHAALLKQKSVEEFDAGFFGISPREAQRMDPQQRLLLEVCWEALEDAGVPADRLRGTRTGLYVGSCTDDYLQLYNNLTDPAAIDGYSSLGTARSITVGRVSYLLGFEGPAVQLDTACSSSLVSLHQACQGLRLGDCDTALAGGVNLQLSPAWTVGLSKLGALAPDGKSKTFDAAANGFVRGEGCGVLVLRRLSDALEQGDRILALVRGTAVNHDGRSSGLTVPSPAAQEKLLRQALKAAGLSPEDVDYIEAHGTGTSLGDPIEMAAIGSVFGARSGPLRVGSVKTNVGHLEAAAGVAGVVKVILALRHDEIPPHLHFREPNPLIPWDTLPVEIPTRPAPWPRTERPRRAGVSSFGFSGTNAHVIVEEAPRTETRAAAEGAHHLLVLSAKDPPALRQLAYRYAAYFASPERAELADVCFTAAVGRVHFEQRLAVVARSCGEAAERLRAWLREARAAGVYSTATAETSANADAAAGSADVSSQEARLSVLARRYAVGEDVDWREHTALLDGRKVSLPTYPFQRTRHWRMEPSAVEKMGSHTAAPAVHPLLGHRVLSAAAAECVAYESRLSSRAPRYLGEHRVAEQAVLPAAAELEMALAAARQQTSSGRVSLEDVTLHRALSVGAPNGRVVQTVLAPAGSPVRFELFSRDATDDDTDSATWTRHASGRVSTPTGDAPPPISLEAIRARCAAEVSAGTIYERIATQGLAYGDSFRLLAHVCCGRGEALGTVEVTDRLIQESADYQVHPAVLDACLHTIAALLTESNTTTAILPTQVERFEVFAPAGERIFSHARLRQPDDLERDGYLTVDVDVLGPDGALVARLEGLRMQQVDPAVLVATDHSTAVDLYDLRWHEAPLPSEPTASPGAWLLLADRGGIAEKLAARLAGAGHRCVLLWLGEPPSPSIAHSPNILRRTVRPESIDDDLREALYPSSDDETHAGVPGGVVHLWGLDARADTANTFAAAHRLACGTALQLVQATLERPVLPRLWFITRGAQEAGQPHTDTRQLAQSPLWGLARVVSVEQPELQCTTVDLDPDADVEEQADALAAELRAPGGESQTAYRRGVRLVQRLAAHQPPAPSELRLGDGSYLITGGLGSLGLETARWLARRGASAVVLSGRHDADTPQQQEALERLRNTGTHIHVLTADVASAEDVRRLLDTMEQTLPPLRGVIHAAGTLDDAALPNQDWPRFDRVMRAKVAGAWHLHTMTGDLDFFVLFSSAVGWLGSPGQANYAAANVFLDALARYRRTQGRPALSIAWGPWEIGMAERLDERSRQRIERAGMRPLRTREAIETLERLLAAPEAPAEVAAMDVDFGRLASALPGSPMCNDLAASASTETSRPAMAGALRAAPEGNRMALLVEHIRGELAAVLELDRPAAIGPRQKLFDLGLDSIMAVELQRRLERSLGCPLPVTLAMDYPSTAALAGYVADQLDLLPAAPPAEAAADDALRHQAEEVASMSDEQIQAMLSEKYRNLLSE